METIDNTTADWIGAITCTICILGYVVLLYITRDKS